jgi:hypothetical protein
LRGCRVPSKVLFTAKHLTVFGLFRIALSKRRDCEKKNKKLEKKKKKEGIFSRTRSRRDLSHSASSKRQIPDVSIRSHLFRFLQKQGQTTQF